MTRRLNSPCGAPRFIYHGPIGEYPAERLRLAGEVIDRGQLTEVQRRGLSQLVKQRRMVKVNEKTWRAI